jgi:Ser/Thr protein kinase RdoA (MazF antagonist)
VKTWNLAGLFRLPTAAGPVWLKTGRQFAVDEAAVIALFGSVDPEFTPPVLAADPERRLLLLDQVLGEDCWGPSAEVVAEAVPRLVRAQAALAASYPGSVPAGLRDRTPAALVPAVKALLDGPAATELTADELAAARAMADRLPELVEQLAACGLPDVVLHGDFHPGNWRSARGASHPEAGEGPAVLVDFADACFGHPALDGLRPKDFCSEERWAQAAAGWCGAWRTVAPGSDPERALRLAAPFTHLGYAVRYQEFLDAIEPSEQRYHAGDPAAEIRGALAAFATL